MARRYFGGSHFGGSHVPRLRWRSGVGEQQLHQFELKRLALFQGRRADGHDKIAIGRVVGQVQNGGFLDQIA